MSLNLYTGHDNAHSRSRPIGTGRIDLEITPFPSVTRYFTFKVRKELVTFIGKLTSAENRSERGQLSHVDQKAVLVQKQQVTPTVLVVAAAERAGYNTGAYNPALYNTGAYAGDYYNRGNYARRGYADQYYGRDGYKGAYAGGRYAAPYRSAYGYAPGYAAGYNRPYSGAYGGYSGYRGYGAYGSQAGYTGYPGYADGRYGRYLYGGAYDRYGSYRSSLFDDRYNQYMYQRGYNTAPYGGAYGPYEQRTSQGYSYGYTSPNSQVYSAAGYRA
ncbi:hypothetical protein HPB49_016194 [Dermacentor silvarum]|uniref:Uncharacterized protein n=1 Tax=Dermacentor silvarum TaxID=543639 RepID=A0ACB8CLI7_DERSI|nr:hypothetical protein HPB49_016194 [Dermacentor silvarum]